MRIYKDNAIMRQIQVSAHSLVLPNDVGVTIDPRALPPRLNVKEIRPSGRPLARMHHLPIFHPHSLSRPLDRSTRRNSFSLPVAKRAAPNDVGFCTVQGCDVNFLSVSPSLPNVLWHERGRT